MANYKRPSDPRRGGRPPKRPTSDTPWLWLLLGFAVTAVAIAVAVWMVSGILAREPLAVSAPAPVVTRITAPATAEPTATSILPTPTPIPTLTPSPTPNRAVAPPELTAGFFARVTGTDGIGLSVRGGSSTINDIIVVAPEESTVLLLEGPVENGGFEWWRLQLEDGTTGWAAGQFLAPTAEPDDWSN